MLNDFLTYVQKQSLFQKNERILLAVSGGIDSVVLVHLMTQAEYEFGIAHCNFSLRGQDANEDQQYVESLASRLNVPYHTTQFDTEQYAHTHQLSLQMAARELRYHWFDTLLHDYSYDYLATAHHHSDSLETVFLNISRGTGISGMRGILPKRKHLVRPLLFATKTDIEEYANSCQLTWREDISNSSDKYRRNFIRHQVIPAFYEINPSFEASTRTTLDRLKDTEDILMSMVDMIRGQVHRQKGPDHYFDKKELEKLPGRTTIIHQLLRIFGFTYIQCKSIVKGFDESGKIFLSKTHQINIDRKDLIISPIDNQKTSPLIIKEEDRNITFDNINIRIEECEVPSEIPSEHNIGLFDRAKVSFPLIVRTWQQGDKFCPLGMSGFKKVSDLLIDTKVPRILKDKVNVLVSDQQIIWVMGHRIDDRVKISKSTRQVLRITLE